jgi:hypothetical protein
MAWLSSVSEQVQNKTLSEGQNQKILEIADMLMQAPGRHGTTLLVLTKLIPELDRAKVQTYVMEKEPSLVQALLQIDTCPTDPELQEIRYRHLPFRRGKFCLVQGHLDQVHRFTHNLRMSLCNLNECLRSARR